MGEIAQNYLQLWDVQNRELLDQIQLQMLRLLHNFVASAFSLIDHSRVFCEGNYRDAGVFRDYEAEVSHRFKKDPFAQFVVGLRKYCQHCAVPSIFSELSVQLDEGKQVSEEHKIYLDRDSLLKFDVWSAAGKDYLRSAPKNIDLLGIVVGYEQKVVEFYQWVDSRLKEIHADDGRCAIVS